MKYILITGATSGIGKGLAEYLSTRDDYCCVLLGRNEQKLQNLSAQLNNCPYVYYDLNDLYHIENIFLEIKEKGILLDGMVHCAGLSPLMKVVENDVDTMLETYRVNFFSFIELAKFFTKGEYIKDNASVIAVSSVTSKVASWRQTIYGSSKAALNMSIKYLQKENLNNHIRFNCLCLGAVETEMLKKLETESQGLREKMNTLYPFGTIDVRKVSEMIEFLISEKSEHIVGSCIDMESGFFVAK